MTLDEFKNLASALQSISIALAFLVGGIWALYRFFSLRSIEKAKTELLKLKHELNERAILEITLTPSTLYHPDTQFGYIILCINIRNCGNKEEVINWKKSRIEAAEIKFDKPVPILLKPSLQGFYQSIYGDNVYTVISPRQKKSFKFIIPVDKVGVYLLDVELEGSPREKSLYFEDAKSVGLEASNINWVASTYYEVVNNKEL